jgi:hypothetical protein
MYHSDPGKKLSRKATSSQKAFSAPALEPSALTSNSDKQILPPPIVVNGSYNGNPITVYGEVHNYIENNFYESLKIDKDSRLVVLVEHATVLCEMSYKEVVMMLNRVEGSEWIWYKLKSRKKPVICIDNRIEVGLLSSIEERYLLSSNDPNDISTLIMYAMKTLQKLESDSIKNIFESNTSRQVKGVYATSIKTIRKQIKMMYDLLQDPEGVDLDEWLTVKDKIFNNIVKIASFMVDIHIVKTIQSSREKKEIAIFVGAAHAYRLHKYFPDMFDKISYNAPDEFIKQCNLDQLIFD